MGDAIKRLFHRRHRSTDKDFRPNHVRALPYRDAVPGTPPRRGSVPLHGDYPLTANTPFNAPDQSSDPTNTPSSLGANQGQAHQNRLTKAAADASSKRNPKKHRKTVSGAVQSLNDTLPESPPLPGTAVTSDDARYGSVHPLAKQISPGESSSCYAEDVSDKVLTESFPAPPVAPTVDQSAHDYAGEDATRNRSSYPVRSKGFNPRDTTSYSLDEASPASNQRRAENTRSRLFLDNSSDEESPRESSRECVKRTSRGSLRRKRAYSSGLRDFSKPTDQYSVQEPTERYYTPESVPDGHAERSAHRSYLIDDSPEPPNLEGVVDLSNTEDITYHSQYAPAVTHETIRPKVHEIREEQIFREIHTHDVFHRILPIIDVEVLPARHFIRNEEGGLRETPAEQIPGRSMDAQARNWLVAELVSRRTRDDTTPIGPRQFTAREFPGTEGDEVRYTTEEGIERTETTWVHPPTIATYARDSGQTEPLYMGPPNAGGLEAADYLAGEAPPQRSVKDLAGGIRDAPFDECAEIEAASERMKTLHMKSDSGVEGSSA